MSKLNQKKIKKAQQGTKFDHLHYPDESFFATGATPYEVPVETLFPKLPKDLSDLTNDEYNLVKGMYEKYRKKFHNLPETFGRSDIPTLAKYMEPEDANTLQSLFINKAVENKEKSTPINEGTGAVYDKKSSGTYDISSDEPTLIQKVAPTAKKLAPALLPLGSLLANLGFIKAAENAALSGMNPVAFNTGQAPVPVVKGLPSEVIAAHRAALAGLIPKKTSDAAYNAMTEQMTFANKMAGENKFAEIQAQDLDSQRKMQQQVLGINAQSAAKAMNEQAAYNAQLSKEKGLIKAQADSERRNAINKILSESVEMVAAAKEKADVRAIASAEYSYNKAINELNALNATEKTTPLTPDQKLRRQYLLKALGGYGAMPTAKKGTKLVQRKKCK